MIPYLAFSKDHQFMVGEQVVVMFGAYPDSTVQTGTVVHLTQRKIIIRFEDGEFRHYSTSNDNREYGSGRSQYTLQYTSHIVGNPLPPELAKEVKTPTLLFAYYDTHMASVTHLDDGVGNPSCGTLYGEEGEFLRSKHEHDAGIMRAWGVDSEVVTCKKCLKILQEQRPVVWKKCTGEAH